MTKNGVTFEVQPDGGVRIYGKAVETVDFFLSMLDYGNDSIFNNSTGNGKILSGGKDCVGIEYHGTNKRLYLTIAKGKTVNTVIYPQLQNGSTATPYELYTGEKPSPSPEYPQEIKNVGKWNPETQKYEVDIKVTNAKESWDKEQTITITSDRPITKWDKLIEQDGQIGWLYETKKYNVTGNEPFACGSSSYYTGHSTDMYLIIQDAINSEGIMKNLSYVENVWYMTNAEGFKVNVKQFHMRLENARIGVSDDAEKEEKKAAYVAYLKKEYEKGTPYELFYKSEQTEFVPLPQEEQDAIHSLMTYYPTTVITADGGELDPDVEVTYIADTKNYIDQKIDSVVKTVVETQKALL